MRTGKVLSKQALFIFFVMAQNMISTGQPFSTVDSLTNRSASRDGRFYESYTLKAERETKFRVYVSSFKFNPRVELLKGKQVVAEVDGEVRHYDAGKDYSAVLEGILESNTVYELIVSSQNRGETGEFTLQYSPRGSR